MVEISKRQFWVVSSLPYFSDRATLVEILVWTFRTQSELHVLVIFMRVVLPSKKNFRMCRDIFICHKDGGGSYSCVVDENQDHFIFHSGENCTSQNGITSHLGTHRKQDTVQSDCI